MYLAAHKYASKISVSGDFIDIRLSVFHSNAFESDPDVKL